MSGSTEWEEVLERIFLACEGFISVTTDAEVSLCIVSVSAIVEYMQETLPDTRTGLLLDLQKSLDNVSPDGFINWRQFKEASRDWITKMQRIQDDNNNVNKKRFGETIDTRKESAKVHFNAEITEAELRTRLRQFDEENAILREDFIRAEELITTLQRQRDSLKRSLDQYIEKHQQLQKDHDEQREALNETLKTVQTHSSALKRTLKERDILQKRLEVAHEEIQGISPLKAKLKKATSDHLNCVRKLAQLQEEYNDKQNECSALNETIAQLQKQNASLQESNARAISDLRAKNQQLTEMNESLELQTCLQIPVNGYLSEDTISVPSDSKHYLHNAPCKLEDSLYAELKTSGFTIESGRGDSRNHDFEELCWYDREIDAMSKQLDSILQSLATLSSKTYVPLLEFECSDDSRWQNVEVMKQKIVFLLDMANEAILKPSVKNSGIQICAEPVSNKRLRELGIRSFPDFSEYTNKSTMSEGNVAKKEEDPFLKYAATQQRGIKTIGENAVISPIVENSRALIQDTPYSENCSEGSGNSRHKSIHTVKAHISSREQAIPSKEDCSVKRKDEVSRIDKSKENSVNSRMSSVTISRMPRDTKNLEEKSSDCTENTREISVEEAGGSNYSNNSRQVPRRKLSVFHRSFDIVALRDHASNKETLEVRRSFSSPSVRVQERIEEIEETSDCKSDDYSLDTTSPVPTKSEETRNSDESIDGQEVEETKGEKPKTTTECTEFCSSNIQVTEKMEEIPETQRSTEHEEKLVNQFAETGTSNDIFRLKLTDVSLETEVTQKEMCENKFTGKFVPDNNEPVSSLETTGESESSKAISSERNVFEYKFDTNYRSVTTDNTDSSSSASWSKGQESFLSDDLSITETQQPVLKSVLAPTKLNVFQIKEETYTINNSSKSLAESHMNIVNMSKTIDSFNETDKHASTNLQGHYSTMGSRDFSLLSPIPQDSEKRIYINLSSTCSPNVSQTKMTTEKSGSPKSKSFSETYAIFPNGAPDKSESPSKIVDQHPLPPAEKQRSSGKKQKRFSPVGIAMSSREDSSIGSDSECDPADRSVSRLNQEAKELVDVKPCSFSTPVSSRETDVPRKASNGSRHEKRQKFLVGRRSLSEGDNNKECCCRNGQQEVSNEEEPKAFPSLSDSRLQELGIAKLPEVDLQYNENLSEDMLERKYMAFSIGLGTDRVTLRKRLSLSLRQRDQTERNFGCEIQRMQENIQELAPLCTDRDSIERVEKVRHQLDMIARCAHRVSCVAETLGAVHQEYKVSMAVILADRYLQVLRTRCEKLAGELTETKRILAENNIVIEENPSDLGEDLPRIRYRTTGMSSNNRMMMARRRASIATISRPLGSSLDVKENVRQRNSVSGRVTLRRPSFSYETQKWENEKLDHIESNPGSIGELREIFEQAESRRNSRDENSTLTFNPRELRVDCISSNSLTLNSEVWSTAKQEFSQETKSENVLRESKICIRTSSSLRIRNNDVPWRSVMWCLLIFFFGFYVKHVMTSITESNCSLKWWSIEELLKRYLEFRHEEPPPI